MPRRTPTWNEFCAEVVRHGLTSRDYGGGHWQIGGGEHVVHYYPFSQNQTMFVEGTGQRASHPSLLQVVQAAGRPLGAKDVGGGCRFPSGPTDKECVVWFERMTIMWAVMVLFGAIASIINLWKGL